MSLPKIRLESCVLLEPGVWGLDEAQERHLVRVLRHYDGAAVEGLLAQDDGRRLLMRLERNAEGFCLRQTDTLPVRQDVLRITLLLGLPKAEQFETVLRCAAEIGVDEIVPLVCARSVPRVGLRELPKKMTRWRRILDEGSKISGSVFPPQLAEPVVFSELDWGALPQQRFAALLAPQTVSLSGLSIEPGEAVFAVGPEGDWTEAEMEFLLRADFAAVDLGRRILRASTAALVGCSWLRLLFQ